MPTPPTPISPTSSLKSPFPPLPPPAIISPEQFWQKFTDDIDADYDALSFSDLPLHHQHDTQSERRPPDAFEDFEFQTCDNGRFLNADLKLHEGQPPPLQASANSSNCSSASVSRSQSSSSSAHSSNSVLPPRLSLSNRFYARPSPKPQVRTNAVPGRKSTGSVPHGWGLIRVGVVQVPEIEITDLRSRLAKANDKNCAVPKAKKRFGFGCKCGSDALEPVTMSKTVAKNEDKTGRKSSRVVDWLEEAGVGNGLKFA